MRASQIEHARALLLPVGAWHTFAKGVDMSANGQAVEAICEHEPGMHYLGTAHTLANFETAFYRSSTADNNSYEQWLEEGETDANMRANKLYKKSLADYEAPPLDEAIDAALIDFIGRRKSEMPDELG